MRHFNSSYTLSGIMAGMSLCMLALFGASCVKEDFDRNLEQSGLLSFDVKVQCDWTGNPSPASTGTSIRSMSQSDSEEPLYLVTEVSEPSESDGREAITKGSPVTSAEPLSENGFGLSAICYTGTWPENDQDNKWTTNFAHNLKVTRKDVTWKTDEKLEWVNSGKIKFFAYYPYSDNSDGAVSHSSAGTEGIPTLTCTIPSDVKQQPDILYAVTECAGSGSGGPVSLAFRHALTAVTIKAGNNMLAGKITGVDISGVYGSGKYRIGSSWTTQGNPRKFEITGLNVSLKQDDKGNGLNTTPGTSITDEEFTFMMVPQTLPTDAQLTIHFTDNLTQTSRTLTAKLGNSVWPSGKRVTYSISSTGIVIEPVFEMTVNRDGQWPNGGYKFGDGHFDVAQVPMTDDDKKAYLPVSGFLRDVDITAYVKVTQASAGTEEAKEQKLELPFQIEYSTDGGTTWTTTKDSKYGWKPASEAKTVGETVKGSILLPEQPSFTESRSVFNGISTQEGKTDWDLTAHNPLSNHSANCYMVHDHGYYKFPAYYGNTYNNSEDTAYSCDLEVTDPILQGKVLEKFIAGDNATVANGKITGIANATLIWQDSPDLVTDIVFKDGWVHFRVPQESLNQGNAVIAVVDGSGTILWNWHIWVTHYDWGETNCIPAGVNNQHDKEFKFAPAILGYCTPHGGDNERNVRIRIKATVPGEKDYIIIVKPVIKEGVSQPDGKGEIAFTQHAVVASIAGDNTYYQWGRKDPMLPGVYNKEIRDLAGTEEEFDIANKVFYSAPEYRFTSKSSAVDIGTTIREPHHFFMHSHNLKEGQDGYEDANYRRRHWHDGSKASYAQKTIANFWNSQLIENGTGGHVEFPNNAYVFKTVYDPCPAGYKIPPPAAFSAFVKSNTYLGGGQPESAANSFTAVSDPSSGINIGWKLGTRSPGAEFFFPATGLRDMGLKESIERGIDYGSWPAHSKLTFIATSGFNGSNKTTTTSSTLLFSIDRREHTSSATQPIEKPLGVIYGTNNAYGFTVLPIRDDQK